jgi:Family of unknown function (DUF6173)
MSQQIESIVEAIHRSDEQCKGRIRQAEVALTKQLAAPPEPNLASEFYRKLVWSINQFNGELDQEHDIGVRLVSFGQTMVFHLKGMGYSNPSLIHFLGTTEDGNPVKLIQHVSQISVLLMAMKRADPSKPKEPLGFHTEEKG